MVTQITPKLTTADTAISQAWANAEQQGALARTALGAGTAVATAGVAVRAATGEGERDTPRVAARMG